MGDNYLLLSVYRAVEEPMVVRRGIYIEDIIVVVFAQGFDCKFLTLAETYPGQLCFGRFTGAGLEVEAVFVGQFINVWTVILWWLKTRDSSGF